MERFKNNFHSSVFQLYWIQLLYLRHNLHEIDLCVEAVESALRLHPERLEEIRASDYNTPLSTAAENGNVEVVKYLLGIGAHINARNMVNMDCWNESNTTLTVVSSKFLVSL